MRRRIAKLVPRQMHQFAECPERHRFLHRLGRANRGLWTEALATEEADASMHRLRPQRSGGVPLTLFRGRHLHP
jgi:hypothetical protein